MKKEYRIATWNIGGAHTINSNKIFDYGQEDIPYFAKMLKPLDLDVICLQESHTGKTRVISELLASMLDMPYVYDSPRSPSHIDNDYQLANAIISRYPIENAQNILLPSPPFELCFEDGCKAEPFPTYIQICRILGITIANTHLQPLHLFGYSWGEGEGYQLAKETEKVIVKSLDKTPLVLSGDFNAPHLLKDYSKLIESFQLVPALDHQPTDIKGNKMDYILCSQEFTIVSSEIIKTEKSDHYLGWAKIILEESNG